MVVTAGAIRVLKKIKEGEKFAKDAAFTRPLELAGIIRFELPGYYTLTYTGEALVELIKSLEDKNLINPDEWPDNFRFIGTEIMGMIEATIKAGGRISPHFFDLLKERGFMQDEELTPEAEELWEIYRLARPQLIITQDLAALIRKLPMGPAKVLDTIDIDDELVLELEAQRLIAFSMPPGDFFNFTGLGQKIKEAIEKGAQPFPVAVSVDIMVSVKRAKENPQELTQTEAETLMAMAYIDEDLNLLPAGEALYAAYELYTKGPLLLTPSIVLEDPDIEILFTIEELWKKYETNPEIFPEPKQIREWIEKKNPALGPETKKILYGLETFGLVKSESFQKKLAYFFTDWGKKVLEDQKEKRRAVSSPAIKCITMTRKEFASPSYNWYQEAMDAGLISAFGPTKSGTLYADLAASIDRLPHLTDLEMEILLSISEKNPLYVHEYQDKYGKDKAKIIKRALELLDAKGLVEILPTDIVILTDAGVYMKKALAGVTSGFGNPVTPLIVRLLEAIREVGTLYEKEKKIRVRPDRWKKVEKLTGLDPDTFSETVTLARRLKFLGTNTLTDAGYYLLLSLDELRKAYAESKKWFFQKD